MRNLEEVLKAAGNTVTLSAGDDMMAWILSDARRTLGLL